MSVFLSKHTPGFDKSADGFRRVAGDVGEVIALLAGGVRPDPESVSRLCLSMRTLQAFLIDEGDRQALGGQDIAGAGLADLSADMASGMPSIRLTEEVS